MPTKKKKKPEPTPADKVTNAVTDFFANTSKTKLIAGIAFVIILIIVIGSNIAGCTKNQRQSFLGDIGMRDKTPSR